MAACAVSHNASNLLAGPDAPDHTGWLLVFPNFPVLWFHASRHADAMATLEILISDYHNLHARWPRNAAIYFREGTVREAR